MKKIQILSSIIATIVIIGGLSYATAEEKTTELKDVVDDISKDLEIYVKDDSIDKPNEATKLQEIKEQYSTILDVAIEKVLDDAEIDYNALNDEEKDILKQLIIQKELKLEKIEDYDEKANAHDKLEKQSIIDWVLPPANAAYCPPVQNITYFVQVEEDINGSFFFEGNNELYNVARENLSNCAVKYTLSFLDEDHPVPGIDQAYDLVRLNIYERIADVEVFYVQSNGINFLKTWSNGQDFGSLGIHHTAIKPFSNTVYVSNTWNHMMDVVDENTSKSKFTWLF